MIAWLLAFMGIIVAGVGLACRRTWVITTGTLLILAALVLAWVDVLT